jgi:hypothetical protein
MMSVLFSGTNQGRFTSTGVPEIIKIRSDLDWMYVLNETVAHADGADTGAEFRWQRGMADGRGIIYTKTSATDALQIAQIAAQSGFYLIDSSVNIPGASTALTGVNANSGAFSSPQALTANTNNLPVTLVAGANNPAGVIRIFNVTGALQLGGLDFTVANVVANTSMDLIYMDSIVSAAAGGGTYRVIPFDPIFYPRRRYITKVIVATSGTAATGNPALSAQQAIVTLSVTHGYTVGQVIRFVVPTVTATAFGMTELNGVKATIIAVGDQDADGATNTIRVDLDVSSFTAFAFPLTADGGFTPAQIVPVGEDTAQAILSGVNLLGDATINTAYIGIKLQAGTTSPAGVSGDVIYWIAGKSFNVDNN